MRHAGLCEAQAGIKIVRRNMQMAPHLWQKWRRTKEPLDESERGEWKSWPKLNIQKTKIMASGLITSWQINGETMEKSDRLSFGGLQNHCRWWLQLRNRHLCIERKVITNLDSTLKSRDIALPNESLSSQGYGFSSCQVWMWESDCEESWAPKNWCFWTVVLEKTLGSPLDCKEIQPVHPKGNQFWVFIGRTDAEAETPILWPPHSKSWLIGKDSDSGRDWEQEEKGTAEDEMAGWHHCRWTWVWVNSGCWWWTGRPGMLQVMGWQRVGHDWADGKSDCSKHEIFTKHLFLTCRYHDLIEGLKTKVEKMNGVLSFGIVSPIW